MNDPYHQSARCERSSEDPYLQAACWERSWEQQQRSLRSQHLQLDEAGWAPLERRTADGAFFRWCDQTLLRLGRRLLTLRRGASTGAATPGAAAPWRSADPMDRRS
jgi:hypothetical protein